MFLTTTPARTNTFRFKSFFSTPLQHVDIPLILKRREPKLEHDTQGHPVMGWTTSCTDQDFEQATRKLSDWRSGFWINIEYNPLPSDLLCLKQAKVSALLSGADLTPQLAIEAWKKLPVGRKHIIALENEAMILRAPQLLDALTLIEPPWGVIIGSSYLSESSKMYDQMGLDRYRSMMRFAGKYAKTKGIKPISTSNYCTFEQTGIGDKNKEFSRAQIDYVFRLGNWGCLSRFYHHLTLADLVAEQLKNASPL